jgi:hypothetical protein
LYKQNRVNEVAGHPVVGGGEALEHSSGKGLFTPFPATAIRKNVNMRIPLSRIQIYLLYKKGEFPFSVF